VTESRDAHLANVVGAFALALVDRIRDATETTAGMSGAAPAALVALRQSLAGRTMDDLAQATGLTHSGAVRLVDRLVEAGLAERRPGRDDRSLSIVLTASGRALSRKVTMARATAIEEALAALNADERGALSELIDTLVGTVTVQRLDGREQGAEYGGWLCRMCDFGSCGRSLGQCPAANAAQSDGSDHRRERRL
jgi:MarR family transcriptional repressor of emrRAB